MMNKVPGAFIIAPHELIELRGTAFAPHAKAKKKSKYPEYRLTVPSQVFTRLSALLGVSREEMSEQGEVQAYVHRTRPLILLTFSLGEETGENEESGNGDQPDSP